MLAKLWCWLFSHRFRAKAYTGQVIPVRHVLRGEEDMTLYRWQAQPFCLRCNHPNPNYEERQ